MDGKLKSMLGGLDSGNPCRNDELAKDKSFFLTK
jgi:hypothetical protein